MSSKDQQKVVEQAKTTGEQKRDNDAQRPDGSAGTARDSTAQQAARGKGQHKP